MRAALLALSVLAVVVFSAVVRTPIHRMPSLREQLFREGKFEDFMKQQEVMRSASYAKNTGSHPFFDIYDTLYHVNITLGTPPQNFFVVLDTGTSNTWLVDSVCTSQACRGFPSSGYAKNQFDTTKSTSFVKDGRPFSLNYIFGSCTGYIANETLGLGGLMVKNQGLGLVTTLADYFGTRPLDGVFGLAWPPLALEGLVPPMQNLLPQLDAPIFTLFFERHVKHTVSRDGGLVTYGAVDNVNCDADITYVTLSSKTYWQFPMYGVKLGSYSSTRRVEAVSNTGWSWIFGPAAAVQSFVKETGAVYDSDIQLYTLPCKGKYPDMVFTISGKDFPVPQSEYLLDYSLSGGRCALTLAEMTGLGFSQDWTLGDTWIRTYCNIHDIGKGRIGFAKARHTEI